MRQQPTKSERTRQYIIEKAAPLINRKGISGTSIADLTAATGLTRGSIYGNFKNKDALVLAVFDYNVASLNQIFTRDMAAADTPGQKLAAYPGILRKLHQRMTAYGGCPVVNTATEADDTHPPLCRRVSKTVRAWKGHLVSLIESGKAGGEIKSDTDSQKTAGLMLSLFEGGGILARVSGEDAFMTDAIDQIEGLIQEIRANQPQREESR